MNILDLGNVYDAVEASFVENARQVFLGSAGIEAAGASPARGWLLLFEGMVLK